MQKRRIITVFAFILLSLAIFLNQDFPPVKFFASAVQNIFSSPKAAVFRLKSGDLASESLKIKKLQEDNEKLTQKLLEYDRTRRDNEALKSQFETGETRKFKLLPAQILGFLGGSSPTTLIINRGQQDGVRREMAVVYKNNLIGKISRVSSSYSQIILINNSAFQTLAQTLEGSVPGIIHGVQDFILLDRVETSQKLASGETIVTKGEINKEGLGIPPDLVIGKILQVSKNESLPFQSAKVEGALSNLRLNTVFIVLAL